MSLEDSPYDASCIRILPEAEVSERWEWAKVGSLAAKYGVAPDWVQRGIEACTRANVSVDDYFIPRYLDGDRAIPMNSAVDEAMKEILKEERERVSRIGRGRREGDALSAGAE